MRRNKKHIFSFLFFILLNKIIFSQSLSPFNQLTIVDTSKNYSFIISGHFHGASTNASGFPASTLLANIDTLNKVKPAFLMSMGDMFIDVDDEILTNYKKYLFNKLNFPLFNSVGNHDLANGNLYEKHFGKTYFSFIKNSELFIVLNSELNDGSIKNQQLDFFKQTIKNNSSEKIKNIFIFSHRPVWAERIEKYANLFTDNTHTQIGKNNFLEELIPILKPISKTKNIFWISGSLGGTAYYSFFYDKDSETNITYMQTAIRDLPRDAVLKINANDGRIAFDGISFTNRKLEPIENYTIECWNKRKAPEQQFSFRMLPYLTKQMLLHYYFWIGFSLAILIVFFFRQIRKRKSRN